MAKIGKYSTGLGKTSAPNAPYGNSNGGYEKRQNMMGADGMTKHEDIALSGGGVTATGKKVLLKTKNVKRRT